jgi:hypothetical protein
MTDLTTFAALHARVYEFLEQQDEATLRSIVDGTARLAIAGADATPRPVATSAPPVPSGDPVQAARDLSSLTSHQERRIYLNAAKLLAPDVKKIARLLGVRGYSSLAKAKLIDLLVAHDAASAPATPPPQRKLTAVATPDAPPPAAPTMPGVDPAAIATRLRETETEDEGAEFLRAQRLDKETLLAVAAELQLTRVDRLRQNELEKRVLKQAIGARRKFSGLRKW